MEEVTGVYSGLISGMEICKLNARSRVNINETRGRQSWSLHCVFMCIYVICSPAPMDIKRPRLSSPADDSAEDSENIVIAETPSPKPRVPAEGRSELKSIAEE